MSLTMRGIYEALQELDCAVTRGWPQALIPLPAIAISGCMDSLEESGDRRFAVDLTLRAASPEGADRLAAEAQMALSPLGLRRSGSKDGAEKDKDCFTKTLRYEAREAPADAAGMDMDLTIGGRVYTARIISISCRRKLADITALNDEHPRLTAAMEDYHRLKLRLPGSALSDVQALYESGEPLMVMGRKALIEGYTLSEGRVELNLTNTL